MNTEIIKLPDNINDFEFLCHECPAYICGGCFGVCECGFKEKFTKEFRFDMCPHKEDGLFITKFGELTTKPYCTDCGTKISKYKGDIEIARIEKIERSGPPGSLDYAPYGTACFSRENLRLAKYDLYVQVSSKEDYPQWKLMGTFGDSYSRSRLKREIEEFKKRT